jgi:signal peptidase I
VLLGLLVLGNSIGYSLHIRSSLFEAFRIPGASMYPTIGVNDRILVDKKAYRRTNPQRGDIIVFHPHRRARGSYIKRVSAPGGDTVSMNGQLYVNGQPLSRRGLPESPAAPVFPGTIPRATAAPLRDLPATNRRSALD